MNVTYCLICDTPVPQQARGRHRRTCSDACRAKLHRRQHTPDPIDAEWKRQEREAERTLRRWERRFGDLSALPGSPEGGPSLRFRLKFRLERGMYIHLCAECGMPFILDGGRDHPSETCSPACRARRQRYVHRLEANYYDNPRTLPEAVHQAVQRGKRVQFCARCHDPFVPTRPDRKYCSARCRKAASEGRAARRDRKRRLNRESARRRRAETRVVVTRLCVGCGTVIVATKRNHRYCSKQCRSRYLDRLARPVEIRECLECGLRFEVNRTYRALHYYCSPACMDRAWDRARHPEALGIHRRCVICGTAFKPKQLVRHKQIYCSIPCSHRAARIRKLGRDRLFEAA